MEPIKVNSKKLICSPALIGDVGHDIFAASDPKIVGNSPTRHLYESVDYIEYDTDLILEPPKGYHTYVFPRSSLSKTNLILANHVAVIDNGYRGTIKLRFKYNIQPKDLDICAATNRFLVEIDYSKIYKKGDKIAQIVFSQSLLPQIEETSSFEATERSERGFGSTSL